MMRKMPKHVSPNQSKIKPILRDLSQLQTAITTLTFISDQNNKRKTTIHSSFFLKFSTWKIYPIFI